MTDGPAPPRTWAVRHGLLLTAAAPLVPQLIGSTVNIWYNLLHIRPLLLPAQRARFLTTITVYNLVVYPIVAGLWIAACLRLRPALGRLLADGALAPEALDRARRGAINLPWVGLLLAAFGWLMCIPVFLLAMSASPDPLAPGLFVHLPVSILISTLIAITHGFFSIELCSSRLLYPVLFRGGEPVTSSGTMALTVRTRGLLWAISAGVCPIASLLLVIVAAHTAWSHVAWFAFAVGMIGIGFGLTTAWLVSRLVTEPLDAMRRAAEAVARGDLDVHIDLLRADEFGPLIFQFNEMVDGLRKRRELAETFGRHVGQSAARRILETAGLGGDEEQVTVMFVDIRDFTARSHEITPQQVVSLLNRFFGVMVEVVEQRHGGQVNKFLGDGFIALFTVSAGVADPPGAAVAAGREILRELVRLNAELAATGLPPLSVGVGIHTGLAVVGCIGSPRRMEYTAIGDAVNIASRVEGLTKSLDRPMLVTAPTFERLDPRPVAEAMPAQPVKGLTEPLPVWAITP